MSTRPPVASAIRCAHSTCIKVLPSPQAAKMAARPRCRAHAVTSRCQSNSIGFRSSAEASMPVAFAETSFAARKSSYATFICLPFFGLVLRTLSLPRSWVKARMSARQEVNPDPADRAGNERTPGRDLDLGLRLAAHDFLGGGSRQVEKWLR